MNLKFKFTFSVIICYRQIGTKQCKYIAFYLLHPSIQVDREFHQYQDDQVDQINLIFNEIDQKNVLRKYIFVKTHDFKTYLLVLLDLYLLFLLDSQASQVGPKCHNLLYRRDIQHCQVIHPNQFRQEYHDHLLILVNRCYLFSNKGEYDIISNSNI